jgi:pimeloyl-ACP methyl ester carboxylesterase
VSSNPEVPVPLVPRHDVPRRGRSGFTIVEERQVHYLEFGRVQAPHVVCLHGGGQTAYMFEELGAALAGKYHVLAPDLPNHGDSDALDDVDRGALASTVPPLFEEFGIDRAVIVGASLGGMTGMTLAAARPELVSGLVLIDIGHRIEEAGVRRIVEFMTAHESFASLEDAATEISRYLPHRKEVRAESLSRNLRQRDDGRWIWKHGLGRRMAEVDLDSSDWDWRSQFEGLGEVAGNIACPVLVLRGTESDVLSDEGAEEVAALIPNARLARVEKAGHLAAGDNPASTVALISGFLADLGW